MVVGIGCGAHLYRAFIPEPEDSVGNYFGFLLGFQVWGWKFAVQGFLSGIQSVLRGFLPGFMGLFQHQTSDDAFWM